MRVLLLTAILIAIYCHASTAQDSSSALAKISGFPDRFLGSINKKTSTLDKALTDQTEKYLRRLQKKEERLKKKLYKLDSNATKNLFLLNTDQQYNVYLEKIRSDSSYDPRQSTGQYMPNADTLQGTLAFMKQNPQLLSSTKMAPADVQSSLARLQQLQGKMQDADQLRQYIKERKEQIKQYLLQFAHVPPGITEIYNGYNQELYYYTQELKKYRESLDDPDELMKKAMGIVEKLPAFQAFIKNNSMFASLFPGASGSGTPQAIAGLQTRDQIAQMMGSQLSGPNAQQAFSNNAQDAQSQLGQLKDRVKSYGEGGGDVDMPNFKPNSQKTKSFLQRLEYGTNAQTLQSTTFYPATTDLGLSVGYKLDDKGNTVGVGASYKVGWGKDISNVNVSSQGAGLRSFVDIKMKASFFASGGLEYNYQQPFSSIGIVKNLNSWQQSGLVGVSKIISMSSKVFKKARLQFFWDFLSYQQVPKSQPFIFRLGYNL